MAARLPACLPSCMTTGRLGMGCMPPPPPPPQAGSLHTYLLTHHFCQYRLRSVSLSCAFPRLLLGWACMFASCVVREYVAAGEALETWTWHVCKCGAYWGRVGFLQRPNISILFVCSCHSLLLPRTTMSATRRGDDCSIIQDGHPLTEREMNSGSGRRASWQTARSRFARSCY